ncbi:hypothetical protein D046_7034, partial [Vibrio parahaemolyticus V-223/04]
SQYCKHYHRQDRV